MIELRHLRYFLAVAETLHFGRAAERLGIAQPPLSQQIRHMEDVLGAPLFLRTRRRVELSPAGRALLPEARATLAAADRAAEVVRQSVRGAVGRLRVAFTGSVALGDEMPRVLHAMGRAWPGVSLDLVEMPTGRQIAAVADGEVDIGFIRPAHLPDHPGLTLRPLTREPLVVGMAAGHVLAARPHLRPEDLRDQPLVLPPVSVGTGLTERVQEICIAAGFVPVVAVEAGQITALLSLAAAGIGVCVVPKAMAQTRVAGMVFRPLHHRLAFLHLALATRRPVEGGALPPVIANFLALAEAVVPDRNGHGVPDSTVR